MVSVLSSSDGTTVSFAAWTIANLLAVMLVFLLVLGIRSLRERFLADRRLALSVVVIISALIGAVKSLLTNLFVAIILGLSEVASDLTVRALSGALSGAIAIPLVAAFAATRQELEIDRDELITRRMQRELRLRVIQEEENSLDSLIRELKSMRSRISRGKQSGDALEAQLTLLKELSNSRVRPLSHRLFEEIESSFPKVGWRELLRAGAKDGPPIGFLVALNLLTLPRNIEVLGLELGVAYSLTTSLLLLGALFVFSRLFQRLGVSSLALTTALIGGSILLSYGVAWLIYPPLGPNFWFIGVALVIWLGQSGLVFIVVRELFKLRAEARSDFELEGAESNAQLASSQMQRGKLGQLLHGQVQSRLMSLSLRGNLGESAKKSLALSELDEIIELLSHPLDIADRTDEPLASLALQWRGFLVIETGGLELVDPDQLAFIYPLVEEAASNAYRHGLAKHISIQFSSEQENLVLRVSDDGTGPRGGRPGVGSKLFDELSQDWSITPGDSGGSVLTFTF